MMTTTSIATPSRGTSYVAAQPPSVGSSPKPFSSSAISSAATSDIASR
jgi:hypothetical protein